MQPSSRLPSCRVASTARNSRHRHNTINGASHHNKCQFGCANRLFSTLANAAGCQAMCNWPTIGTVSASRPTATQPRPGTGNFKPRTVAMHTSTAANAMNARRRHSRGNIP